MTEGEWHATDDPKPMLRYLIGTDAGRVQDVEAFLNSRGSGRKLRLFACACYDNIRHVLPHPVAGEAVRIAERFADAVASECEYLLAEARVRELSNALEPRWRVSSGTERVALHPTHSALALAGVVCWDQPEKAAWYASSNAYLDYPYITHPGVEMYCRTRWEAEDGVKRAHCGLLRDIFGNPFRPVAFDPAWRTDTAVSLARGMYESRDFTAMPILADALQDAGCEHADVLNHARDPKGAHVRGCWVVDLVLGKA